MAKHLRFFPLFHPHRGSFIMQLLYYAAGFLFALVVVEGYTFLPEFSVLGPFKSFDSEGIRTLPGWRVGGHAQLQENFVRLTNDRQSKRASLWCTSRLGLEEWSTTFRFRVSGQGRRLFGDGLALWFTSRETHLDGDLHGFTNTFTGFGVILDT